MEFAKTEKQMTSVFKISSCNRNVASVNAVKHKNKLQNSAAAAFIKSSSQQQQSAAVAFISSSIQQQ